MTDVSNCVSKIPSVDVIPKVEAMITVYERASAKYAQLLATVGAKVKKTEELAALSGLIILVTSARIGMEDKYKEIKQQLSKPLAGDEKAKVDLQTLKSIASKASEEISSQDESTDACANVWQRRLIEVCEATALSEESAIKSLKELGYADTTIRVLVPHSECTGEGWSSALDMDLENCH